MDWRIFNKLIDLHMYAKLQYNILQILNIIAASRAKYVQDMCEIDSERVEEMESM